ncbi:MAG: NAD(+) synthase [Clostridia bacterium]|nr:NAD(+) synthase [Clostridia bacterium]
MKHGFIKVAAATPTIKVADCNLNAENIIVDLKECASQGAKIIVFPELVITGYTSGDLFYQETLQDAAIKALSKIRKASVNINALIFVGLPLRVGGRIYNTAAAIFEGRILGVIPKTYLPNYNEFYEKRQFGEAPQKNSIIELDNQKVVFGTKILFQCRDIPELIVAAEICEDLWVMTPPSAAHALAGASVIVNLSASNETVGKEDYRRNLVCGQSARLISAYIYSDIGDGESTTDIVFAGHNIIAENGKILAETQLFQNKTIYSEIDVYSLAYERSKLANYAGNTEGYDTVEFVFNPAETVLTRQYPKYPFVPSEEQELSNRAELILTMQAHGLKKRIHHTGVKTVVIGVSGGLDSALALLVAARAVKLAGKDANSVLGVTMPCFGTTNRTLTNAQRLMTALGTGSQKVEIGDAVKDHLNKIGHTGQMDVTFENAQARERTQVLMDIANLTNGLVVGTGDLSELALGWATYNGDHMSMYGVNASVPKTLVKYLIRYEALKAGGELKEVLLDILDTPISPELLPPQEGEIAQITEDLVGPYALHDFFMYYLIRMGFPPSKVYRIAKLAFLNEMDEETVKKWLEVFIKRFFSQQFKRSCLPDGVKIGSVALSPRGDWRMPSDASPSLWLKELEQE